MPHVHIATAVATAVATIPAPCTTAASDGSIAAFVAPRSGRTATWRRRRRRRRWRRQVRWMVQPDLRSGQSLRPSGLLGLLVLHWRCTAVRRVVRLEPQVQPLQQRRLRRLPVLSPTASPAKPADAPTRAAPATKPTDTSALIAPASSVSSRTTGRAALSTRAAAAAIAPGPAISAADSPSRARCSVRLLVVIGRQLCRGQRWRLHVLGKVLHSIAATATATLPARARATTTAASPAAPPANVPAPSLPASFPTAAAAAAAIATTAHNTTTTVAAAPSAKDDAGRSSFRAKRPVSCAGRRSRLPQYLPGLDMRHLLWEAHLRKPRRHRLHLLRVLQRYPRRAVATWADVDAGADADADASVRLLADQQMELPKGEWWWVNVLGFVLHRHYSQPRERHLKGRKTYSVGGRGG
jgi:hypothetical protein